MAQCYGVKRLRSKRPFDTKCLEDGLLCDRRDDLDPRILLEKREADVLGLLVFERLQELGFNLVAGIHAAA